MRAVWLQSMSVIRRASRAWVKWLTYSDMIDPDHIGVVEGDRVAAPDVLGVEVRDGHISGRVC
jgi:hypothetical protein